MYGYSLPNWQYLGQQYSSLAECRASVIRQRLLEIDLNTLYDRLWFLKTYKGIGNGREVWLNLRS